MLQGLAPNAPEPTRPVYRIGARYADVRNPSGRRGTVAVVRRCLVIAAAMRGIGAHDEKIVALAQPEMPRPRGDDDDISRLERDGAALSAAEAGRERAACDAQ